MLPWAGVSTPNFAIWREISRVVGLRIALSIYLPCLPAFIQILDLGWMAPYPFSDRPNNYDEGRVLNWSGDDNSYRSIGLVKFKLGLFEFVLPTWSMTDDHEENINMKQGGRRKTKRQLGINKQICVLINHHNICNRYKRN